MSFIEVSKTKSFYARYGLHVEVTRLENIADLTALTEPSWPQGSYDRELTFADGKQVATYSEYVATGSTTGDYSIRGTVAQEPLETHYRFTKGDKKIEETEWKKYAKFKNDPSTTTWRPDGDEATDNFKEFFSFIERGIEYYLASTVEMTVTKIVEVPPVLANIGTIDPPDNAPTLPRSRDWLIVGIDADKLNDRTFRVVTTYRASGDGGWENDLYKFS